MSLSKSRIDSFILEEIFSPGCRSVRNLEEVSIRFINNSHDTVDLCWIDFRVSTLYVVIYFPETNILKYS